jgi:hypothetical protein
MKAASMTTGVERRRAPRHSVFLPVHMPTSGTEEMFGVTRDVSSGGLFFYTELEYLEAGSRIEFVFQFPPQVSSDEGAARCRGTVVRTEAAENARGIAVRIDRISFLDS